MTSGHSTSQGGLRRALGGFQYFTIALGSMIGIGWITVLGEWIVRAGPLGAMLGFVLGGAVMLGVAACYAELMCVMPAAGGDVVFAERAFGRNAAFFVGWFLLLTAITVVSFEALSFAWVVETLLPTLQSQPLYQVNGEIVTAHGVGLGLGILICVYAVHCFGARASAGAQDALTVFKLLVIVAFVAAGLAFGDVSRLSQASWSSPPESGLGGTLWIAATCAFWLGGFQIISQAAEERSTGTSLRLIALITTSSVVLGVLFYVGVVAAAALSLPIDTLVSAPLPAAAAAEAVFTSRWGAAAVLLAGLCGIVATLNAMILSGSRVALALARLGFLPAIFLRTDRYGVPRAGLVLIVLVAALGVFGGKTLLIPVVTTASISLIASYVLACAVVVRLRHTAPHVARAFAVPGGIPIVLSIAVTAGAMAAFVIIEPAIAQGALPLEWKIWGAWVLLGIAFWAGRDRWRKKDAQSRLGPHETA